MRFRLTYSGQLKASGNNSNRLAEKNTIRRSFSPQLEELWTNHKALQGNITAVDDDYYFPIKQLTAAERQEAAEARRKTAVAQLKVPVVVGGRQFIPLMRRSHDVCCSIDILFLRKDNPGSLIRSAGDIDNRMKTLFDGLRVPTADELKHEDDTGRPMYCLTEDDAFISDFSVKTDFLLTSPGGEDSDVLLVLDITISTFRFSEHNAHLTFN